MGENWEGGRFCRGLNVLKKGKLSYRIDEELFYKNQFIFDDSKATLTWLMNNDKDFLRELFLKYGYDKSDIINKMMIDEVKEEGELPIGKEYKGLFVSKGAVGRLLIHQGLLQYIWNMLTGRIYITVCWMNIYHPCWTWKMNQGSTTWRRKKDTKPVIYRVLLWSYVWEVYGDTLW